ncbi:AEC family transporter [Anoxynatronum buryatiense]|uniref:Permease n=1 Tax=Anoxynatronum buryatiense TaxID=489973 RepID=A0AA45WWJ8_9CLOT|nr:AEC family transporter [Anoxynatronum buryatiense]SMP60206.1 hypothetical protein SAMN06296020_10868 [Anoxynatronum buryatiense]
MNQVITQMIPVILLMAIGKWMGTRNLFSTKAIEDLKGFVMNVTLPAVLFLSFLKLEFRREYLLLILLMIGIQFLFFAAGHGAARLPGVSHPLIPFLSSGAAFGFIGIPFFLAVYGIEELGKYSILGVGHELFIWFFLFPWMRMQAGAKGFTPKEILQVAKSPTILSIVVGILMNQLQLARWAESSSLLSGMLLTIDYLAGLTTPLIMLMVGYSITFHGYLMKDSLKLVLVRMGIIFAIGYGVKWLLIDRFIPADPVFDHAYFTFLVLPPPLVVPMFIDLFGNKRHTEIVSNTLMLHIVASVGVYLLVVLL